MARSDAALVMRKAFSLGWPLLEEQDPQRIRVVEACVAWRPAAEVHVPHASASVAGIGSTKLGAPDFSRDRFSSESWPGDGDFDRPRVCGTVLPNGNSLVAVPRLLLTDAVPTCAATVSRVLR